MAVETNKDATVSPAQTLTGVAAAVASNSTGPNGNGKAANRRKRPSSLLAVANQLPSVENSLDDFISRANQTLTDPDQWHAAENASKAEDEQRREADQLRARAAEQQLREGEQREVSLRRQLDGLQGQLAEAEARAAVANNGGTQDGVIADLKIRLSRADERIVAAEQSANQADGRVQQISSELASAKAAAVSAPIQSAQFFAGDASEADERVRLAEAKAVKALAVARAASAGLTVNPADIAAIESGLVVPMEPARKGTNWLAIVGALVVGGAVAFGIAMALKHDPAPAAIAAPAAPVVAAPAKPVVTPIEETKPAVEAAKPVEAAPVQAVERPAPVQAAERPAPVQAAPVQAAPVQHVATPASKQHTAPMTKHTAPASNGGIADPFGDAPAKKAAKKVEKKPAPAGGAIVDPF
jgi:hypothetical protein